MREDILTMQSSRVHYTNIVYIIVCKQKIIADLIGARVCACLVFLPPIQLFTIKYAEMSISRRSVISTYAEVIELKKNTNTIIYVRIKYQHSRVCYLQ